MKVKEFVLTPEMIVGVAKVKTGFSIPGLCQTYKILLGLIIHGTYRQKEKMAGEQAHYMSSTHMGRFV